SLHRDPRMHRGRDGAPRRARAFLPRGRAGGRPERARAGGRVVTRERALMEVLTNTGSFIVVLGIIIFCHEFGHFITAKAFGMRVFVFSFGFGRRLVGFKWGDTDCRISLIPLGGYVKLEGEPEDHISENTSTLGDGRDFTARPRWQRFVVYFAGPVFNGILA